MSDGVASALVVRKPGSFRSLLAYGAPSDLETALPDFGDT